MNGEIGHMDICLYQLRISIFPINLFIIIAGACNDQNYWTDLESSCVDSAG